MIPTSLVVMASDVAAGGKVQPPACAVWEPIVGINGAGLGASLSIPIAQKLVVRLVTEGGGSPPVPAAQRMAEREGLPSVPSTPRLVMQRAT